MNDNDVIEINWIDNYNVLKSSKETKQKLCEINLYTYLDKPYNECKTNNTFLLQSYCIHMDDPNSGTVNCDDVEYIEFIFYTSTPKYLEKKSDATGHVKVVMNYKL